MQSILLPLRKSVQSHQRHFIRSRSKPFGHPESTGALLGVRLDAGRAYGHSNSAFLRYKCLHLATQRPLGHFLRPAWTRGGPMATRPMPFCLINAYIWPPREPWRTFSVRLDAGRAYGHSNSAFLPYKCLHLATQRALGHFWASGVPFCLINAYI